MGYTRQEILQNCKCALEQAETFYQADMNNYRGRTTDTQEYYTEVIADFLCQNIRIFKDGIKKISRKKSYRQASHTGNYNADSNREEEITAIKMFNQSKNGGTYSYIGTIIDYQTPLKATSSDTAGKVDLLSFDGDILRLLELKKKNSEETMLRCVLEGYTYLKTIDTEKLLSDFNLPESVKVKASPFVFKGGEQQKEMSEDRPHLKRLMELLDSQPFYINENNGTYSVGI